MSRNTIAETQPTVKEKISETGIVCHGGRVIKLCHMLGGNSRHR